MNDEENKAVLDRQVEEIVEAQARRTRHPRPLSRSHNTDTRLNTLPQSDTVKASNLDHDESQVFAASTQHNLVTSTNSSQVTRKVDPKGYQISERARSQDQGTFVPDLNQANNKPSLTPDYAGQTKFENNLAKQRQISLASVTEIQNSIMTNRAIEKARNNHAFSYEQIPLKVEIGNSQRVQSCIDGDSGFDSDIRGSFAQNHARNSQVTTANVVLSSQIQPDAVRVETSAERENTSMMSNTQLAQSNHVHLNLEPQGIAPVSQFEDPEDRKVAVSSEIQMGMGLIQEGADQDRKSEKAQSISRIPEGLVPDSIAVMKSQEQAQTFGRADAAKGEAGPASETTSPAEAVAFDKDYLDKRQSCDNALQKDQRYGLSSDQSHGKTRSAVDKGNFEQQCTDQSEGRVNHDSQQDSAVSQYFNQIEPEAERELVKDEYFAGPVNADLVHLEQPLPPSHGQPSAITELAERSKESTDQPQHSPSQDQLEYSGSMNLIETDDIPLGGEPGDVQTGVDSEFCASAERPQRESLAEQTPQFQGSNSIILEVAAEESTIEAVPMHQASQQPNYESDTGLQEGSRGAASSACGGNVSRMRQEEIKVSDMAAGEINSASFLPNGERLVTQRSATEQDYIVGNFELERSLKILPGSENYNPQVCASETTIAQADLKGSIESSPEKTLLTSDKQVDSNDDGLEELDRPIRSSMVNQNGSLAGEIAHQNRYEIQEQPVVKTSFDARARGSSRFSKGHHEELDKVADRINKSLLLNTQSAGDEEQMGLIEAEVPYVNHENRERDLDLNQSQDSSELPRGATSHQIDHSRKSKAKSSSMRRKKDHEVLVKEQSTPKRDSFISRRESRAGQPRFPEPVDEARQRFSTPRHESCSPISKTSTISRKQRSNSLKRGTPNYPVEIRKHKVIRGPVLKSHYDKEKGSVGQPAKLKVAASVKQRRKTTGKHMMSKQDESLISSLNQGSRAKSLGKANHNRKSSIESHLNRERAEHPSICLPKRRIKPAKQPKAASPVDDSQAVHSDESQTKGRNQDQKGRAGLGESKNGQVGSRGRDVRVGKRQQRKNSKAAPNNLRGNLASIFRRNENMSQDKRQTFASDNHDMSYNSGISKSFYINTRGEADTGKKPSPRYQFPGPITIDTSTIDFQDSTARPFGGVSVQQAQDLSIDQLYNMMAKNWNHDKMLFEQKCKQVLAASQKEAEASASVITPEQDKNRQQRFELLKQRLMQSSVVRNRRQPEKPVFSEEQVQLNQNLKDIESVLNQSSNENPPPVNINQPSKVQYGQFQFIFRKPEQLNPSSPRSVNAKPKFTRSAHQSQNQLRFPGSNPNVLPSTLYDATVMQKSQILTPKIASLQDVKGMTRQQVMAINMTPTEADQSQLQSHSLAPGAFMHNRNAPSVNTHTANQVTSIKNNNSIYQDSIPLGRLRPKAPGVRAATANNQDKRAPNVFAAAFNSSQGFQSSSSVKRNMPSAPRFIATQQPSATNQPSFVNPISPGDQKNLIQKLHYRSMRGRRIKDYLAQVQSQKVTQTQGQSKQSGLSPIRGKEPSKAFKNEQRIVDLQIDSQPSEQTLKQGTQVQSYSSFQYQDDYGQAQQPNSFQLQNKLANSANAMHSEDENSLNQLESRYDLSAAGRRANFDTKKPSESMGSAFSAIKSNDGVARPPIGDEQTVLNMFLAQQDKRIDFGLCALFSKVRDGAQLELRGPDSTKKVLKLAEVESLINFIKNRNLQSSTKAFQVQAHDDCFNSIQVLLTELGMGYRATRMQRDDAQVNTERVYVMACRAHKLHRARIELISIFDCILQLEEVMPKLKQRILGMLSESTLRNHGSQQQAWASYSSSAAANHQMIDEDMRSELEQRSREIKSLLSQLVTSIPSLLKTFKFFNDSFVFADKDYLKYLSKEANEIKGLLRVQGVDF